MSGLVSFTVYTSKTDSGFRVVAGAHKRHEGAGADTVRVYQGADLQSSARAAYHLESRADIRAAIARFIEGDLPDTRTGERECAKTAREAAIMRNCEIDLAVIRRCFGAGEAARRRHARLAFIGLRSTAAKPWVVGGRKRFATREAAEARCAELFQRAGVVAALEFRP